MIKLKILSILALSLTLGGCAASAALQIASLGISGLSYAVSGKSLSDHALSIVLQRDCALLRLAQGRPPCRESEAGTGDGLLLAEDAPFTLDDETFETPPTRVPVPRPADPPPPVVASTPVVAAPTPAAASTPVAAAPIPVVSASPGIGLAPPPEALLYAVIASFENPASARALRARQGGLPATVVPFRVRERTLYRVLLGPFEESTFAPIRSRLRAARIEDAWPLRLCQDSLKPPPCGTLVAQVN